MKSVSVQWFEIPVQDMDRAINFYQEVFECELSKQLIGDLEMAWFPFDSEKGGASGSLVLDQEYKVSDGLGVMVYFGVDDCAIELGRVEKAGGKVELPKQLIGAGLGYFGIVIDSEGNRVAFHSNR